MSNICFQRLARSVTAILILSVVGYGSTAYGFPTNFPVTCTTKTADASAATVQSAINAASNGAVVCIAPGTATWSGTGAVTISGNKNIVLAGAAAWGGGSTTITGGAPRIRNLASPWSGSRITGFIFALGGSSYITIEGAIGYRIDHNTISQPTWTVCIEPLGSLVNGVSASPSEGLIDHNSLTNCRIVSYGEIQTTGGHRRWSEPLNMGTAHANYIEDNTCTNRDAAIHNCVDGNMGGRYVARFNTLNNMYFDVTFDSGR